MATGTLVPLDVQNIIADLRASFIDYQDLARKAGPDDRTAALYSLGAQQGLIVAASTITGLPLDEVEGEFAAAAEEHFESLVQLSI